LFFRFYWKVIYDPTSKYGVALIGVNNPHLPEEEISSMKICDEIPDHPLILGLANPDDIYKGITYACTIEDAKRTIFEIPDFEVLNLLPASGTRFGTYSYYLSVCMVIITFVHR
jgi:hypothetical protein